MNASLNEVKQHIAARYLGKAGIHAVGLRRAQGKICLYVDSEASGSRDEIMPEIASLAAPFIVETIVEQRPRALRTE